MVDRRCCCSSPRIRHRQPSGLIGAAIATARIPKSAAVARVIGGELVGGRAEPVIEYEVDGKPGATAAAVWSSTTSAAGDRRSEVVEREGVGHHKPAVPKDFTKSTQAENRMRNRLNSLNALGKSPLRKRDERVQSRDHSQSTGFRFLGLTVCGFESRRSHATFEDLEVPKGFSKVTKGFRGAPHRWRSLGAARWPRAVHTVAELPRERL